MEKKFLPLIPLLGISVNGPFKKFQNRFTHGKARLLPQPRQNFRIIYHHQLIFVEMIPMDDSKNDFSPSPFLDYVDGSVQAGDPPQEGHAFLRGGPPFFNLVTLSDQDPVLIQFPGGRSQDASSLVAVDESDAVLFRLAIDFLFKLGGFEFGDHGNIEALCGQEGRDELNRPVVPGYKDCASPFFQNSS